MTTITNSSKFINIATNEYPISLQNVRRALNHMSLPTIPNAGTLAKQGYIVVSPTSRPDGDVVTEASPELKDGKYIQSWSVRDYNEDELAQQLVYAKERHMALIDDLLESKLKIGVEYDFGDIVEHVDVTPESRANLTTLTSLAQTMVLEGLGDETVSVRTVEGNDHDVTYIDYASFSKTVLLGYIDIINYIQDLRDLTKLADSISDLPDLT